jgi:hypothetical protein
MVPGRESLLSREHPFENIGKKWGTMVWTKDVDRVAINKHLHQMHDGYAASGDTLARMVTHENIHHDAGGWAGKPLHQHYPNSLEFVEMVSGTEDEDK